jgi:hypothetical protein
MTTRSPAGESTLESTFARALLTKHRRNVRQKFVKMLTVHRRGTRVPVCFSYVAWTRGCSRPEDGDFRGLGGGEAACFRGGDARGKGLFLSVAAGANLDGLRYLALRLNIDRGFLNIPTAGRRA